LFEPVDEPPHPGVYLMRSLAAIPSVLAVLVAAHASVPIIVGVACLLIGATVVSTIVIKRRRKAEPAARSPGMPTAPSWVEVVRSDRAPVRRSFDE
jgi:hypothetical protein